MRLAAAARAVDGVLVGDDALFCGCVTDSRTLPQDALFVALRGPRFDGHDFLDQARAAGAAGAMLERRMGRMRCELLVKDTRAALGVLASVWRRRFERPIVAITGSNGKTTVKEMLHHILAGHGQVLATQGNFNNDIGVPLTLFQLDQEHRYAVLEMGANHPGEISALCALARPNVACVTQCAPAHLEGFGTIDGVAKAKGEIFAALPSDGTAVLNADDAYASFWQGLIGERRCIRFGLSPHAEVRADDIGLSVHGSAFELVTPSGASRVTLSLPGKHNVLNALAAAASAEALGAPLSAMRQGLESMRPVQGRLEVKTGRAGCRVLDDSYNANSGSFKAALEVLGQYAGERWLVLGDMGELGPAAFSLHYQLGEMAHQAGVKRLYAVGELSRQAVAAFGPGGCHFASPGALLKALEGDLNQDLTILIKGSRAARMENVVNALLAGAEQPCC
ncbi:MAG: UDP-N-acetylmuramoyl-tripeptide--D-alanyl-D-alanine ligase [Gammaproteobacteria bacterium]